MKSCFGILISVTILWQTTKFNFAYGNSMRNIMDHLFDGERYNKKVRPVVNWETQTIVELHLSVVAILDFNDVEETISIAGILELSWADEFLIWDQEAFDNLSHISIPQDDVWKPHISLENSVQKLGELGTPSLTVSVLSNGSVEWKPVEVFATACAVDVSKFPFDTQTCSLVFEANGFGKEELEIKAKGSEIEFHDYEGTSGWIITSTEIETHAEDIKTHIVCWLTLERKPIYFVLNIFLPICILSLLNIFVFILPVESGEKVSFVVTVFLSLCVFLTIVSGKMPENSESISLLNAYVFTSLIMSTLITVITIVEIRLHNNESDIAIPRCLTLFANYCASSKRSRTSEVTDIRFMKTVNVHRNSILSVGKLPVTDADMNWQRIVKGLDVFFFISFLVFYCGFTLTWLVIATKS